MTFVETVSEIIKKSGRALTPQEIRDQIKISSPQFYGTESHKSQVAKGNYNHLDHALMAQVYGLSKNSLFVCDRSVSPLKLSLAEDTKIEGDEEVISVDDIEKNKGFVYILKTGTFNKDGREIMKIGFTTKEMNRRIDQLYSTGVPYRFEIYKSFEVTAFTELEKALHLLLARFRINPAREFFTEDAVPFVERIVLLHTEINGS
jgi:T5orf172 domain